MKANTPSLIVYFSACFLSLLLNFLGHDEYVAYSKAVVVPSIFIYYLISNNFKISVVKSLIFLFTFIGDIFILTKYNDSDVGSALAFSVVYVLLFVLVFRDLKRIEFKKRNIIPIIMITTIMCYILIIVLGFQFEKVQTSFIVYIVYGCILSFLTIVSVAKYIAKGSFLDLNLVIMCLCFILSDIYHVLNNYEMSQSVFSQINIVTQMMSYFFMVIFFIELDKMQQNLDNN